MFMHSEHSCLPSHPSDAFVDGKKCFSTFKLKSDSIENLSVITKLQDENRFADASN